MTDTNLYIQSSFSNRHINILCHWNQMKIFHCIPFLRLWSNRDACFASTSQKNDTDLWYCCVQFIKPLAAGNPPGNLVSRGGNFSVFFSIHWECGWEWWLCVNVAETLTLVSVFHHALVSLCTLHLPWYRCSDLLLWNESTMWSSIQSSTELNQYQCSY